MRRVTSSLHLFFGVCAIAFVVSSCGGSDDPGTSEPGTQECAPGEYSPDGAEFDCSPCPAGHYCLGGDAQPVAHRCGEGEFIESYSSEADERTCAPFTVCDDPLEAVEILPLDGSATEDVRCCDVLAQDVFYDGAHKLPRRPSGCLILRGAMQVVSIEPFPIELVRVGGVYVRGYSEPYLNNLADI